MANFVIIVDPDIERRTRFIQVIEPLLPPVEGLVTATCSTGDFGATWASQKQAPVSLVADDQGAAVVWGDAISGAGPERVTSTQLRHLWGNLTNHIPDAFDGFHAAVVYHPDYGLIVGADLLGLFPVYHYATGDVILVGSSPELFRYHPAFRAEFNPAGLVGILLTNGLIDGHTLLRGVQRLAAGHLLVWRPGVPLKEVQQYELPVSTRHFDLPFSAQVDLLYQALDGAVARHVPLGQICSLLLSGGLDSRMLGGFLRQKGVDVKAVTWGVSTDFDMRYAVPVARTLGFYHHTANCSDDQYPHYADLRAKWEHVANGFNNVTHWNAHLHLRKLATRVVTGYVMDAILGGSHISWAYSLSNSNMSFEAFFARVNDYSGIRPDILKKLLRYEVFGDLVQETVARIKTIYESYSEFESQRAWCFDLHHRQRFHVGSILWLLSFGAWPVQPAIDRQVLECAGGMPAATLADRRAQEELLCRRFPALASLPLDRGGRNPEPLRPRLRYLLTQSLHRQLGRLCRQVNFGDRQKREQRYYLRINDFNGPGWIAVRQQANPYRERVLNLFNKDVLDELLPGPDVPLLVNKDGFVEAFGLKSLLGFILWSKDHL